MTQRDVTDADGLVWACTQAYAGLGEGAAAEHATGDTVAVVCTPTGAARTVRLALAPDWEAALPDAELLAAIAEAHDRQDAERAQT